MMIRVLDQLRVRWRTRHNLRVAPTWRGAIRVELTRDWPEEWDVILRSISPRTAAYSYVYPHWESRLGKVRGRWIDRSRWVLYQAQPAWALSEELHAMMREPPPRAIRDPGLRYARSAHISDYAYDMYHEHRVMPFPFWVLQGQQGGTPVGYTPEEQRALQEMGEPTEPPPIGALPYCGFDGRVVEQILMRDRLLASDMNVDTIVQPKELIRSFHADLDRSQKQARTAFIDWFKGTLAPGADFLTWYSRRTESDRMLRPATKGEMIAARETEETYIETGQVPVVTDAA